MSPELATYLTTFGYCVVSAFVPLVNAEAYLVGLAALTDPPDVWLLAGCAAGGQMVGKVCYYLVGRGVLKLPRLLQRRRRPPGRWTVRLERIREKAEERPVYAALVVALAAVAGLPPFAAVALLAGVVRLPWWLFVPIGLAGRYARFAVLLAVPGVWARVHHLA